MHETFVDSLALEKESVRISFAPLSARRLEDSRSLPQGLSSVKTFALLCADDEPQNADIASALIEVDDFLVCPYQENENIDSPQEIVQELSARGAIAFDARRM